MTYMITYICNQFLLYEIEKRFTLRISHFLPELTNFYLKWD